MKKRKTRRLILDRMMMNKIFQERKLSRMLVHQENNSPILFPV
jgi:hypothetical protein